MSATAGFDSELSIRARNATTWELTLPLIWTGSKGDTFVVPAGFVTDFATVPRFLHWLVLPYGPYTRAAVLHDWLLTELARWEARYAADFPGLTRRSRYSILRVAYHPPATSRDTDGIFRLVMEQLGVPWTKRWLMWAAVRAAALFNSRRAYGRQFWRDAPKVGGLFLLALPVLLPGTIGVLVSLGIVRIITWFHRGTKHREDT